MKKKKKSVVLIVVGGAWRGAYPFKPPSEISMIRVAGNLVFS